MSTGAPLNLTLEPSGFVGWTAAVNENFTAINTAIAALQAGGSSGPPGSPGSAGAVGIIWAGPWGSGASYVAKNAVSFNGSSYFALAPSTGVQPDINPSTWAILALAGATGPTGLQGPVGPAGSGGGTSVTFPITVLEGGTGATDPADARTNLGAAASGVNGDITSLSDITTGTTTTGQQGITIKSPSGIGNALTVSSGGIGNGGITTDGGFYAAYLNCLGGVVCGAFICSSRVQVGEIGEAVSGAGINIDNEMRFANGILLVGPAPSATTGQIGLGHDTASSASPGGTQTVPVTVLTYLLINLGGVIGKIPVFAA